MNLEDLSLLERHDHASDHETCDRFMPVVTPRDCIDGQAGVLNHR